MEQTMKIGLYDPGMTALHRLGLAGLFMTLNHFETAETALDGARWQRDHRSVALTWDASKTNLLEAIASRAFGSTDDGLLDFAAWRDLTLGDAQKVHLHNAVLSTFLQHNKQNLIPKGTSSRQVSFLIDEKSVTVSYRPLVKPYAHAIAPAGWTDKKGRLKKTVKIKGWLFPGAAERHSRLTGTEIQETPSRALCLLFAPMACLYYRLSHTDPDGKWDERRHAAIVMPHVTDLVAYARAYGRALDAPVRRLAADGMSDAALSALIELKADKDLSDLGVDGCTVVTMGNVAWNKQQKRRTGSVVLRELDPTRLELFEIVTRILPNRIHFYVPKSGKSAEGEKPETYLIGTSLARGLIAENVAAGRAWYQGFTQLMTSGKRAKKLFFERGGLTEMVNEAPWPDEACQKFVEAVHTAIRSRYGSLAARATAQGERIPFDREFERMRTGLMRVKNATTLRAEVADLFARGGINPTLQKEWKDVLPLLTGKDWQLTRDLSLLALASYSGRGQEELVDKEENESLETGETT